MDLPAELAASIAHLERSLRDNATLDCAIACFDEALKERRAGNGEAASALQRMGEKLRSSVPASTATEAA